MSLKADMKLKEKKYRAETGLFMVEGKKGILELLSSHFRVHRIYVTLDESSDIEAACEGYRKRNQTSLPVVEIVAQKNLSHGALESNEVGIAIAEQRPSRTLSWVLEAAKNDYIIVLDTINDPGNLGTIIRTADWFGITHIITSPTTVDVYNPKVIRGSMGSFTRVEVTDTPLVSFLEEARENGIPSYGAYLDGMSIRDTQFSKNGLIVMGSESHGIHDTLTPLITHRITIPRSGHAESRNVGVATGIILSAIRQ